MSTATLAAVISKPTSPDNVLVGRGELRAFWLARLAFGLPRMKTILRKRRILLVTETNEHIRRVEVLVSQNLFASDVTFWLPRRASDWRAFYLQRKTRNRFGRDAKKITRTPLQVGDARPADVVTVPLAAVIPTISADEVRHLVLDLAYPLQYAVFCPALRYCPIISEHDAEIKAAKDAKQEAADHAKYVKRISEYLTRRRHSPKIRRAILDATQGRQTLRVIAKRAGCSYNGLRVQIHRVCRNLAAEMEAEATAEQETSK